MRGQRVPHQDRNRRECTGDSGAVVCVMNGERESMHRVCVAEMEKRCALHYPQSEEEAPLRSRREDQAARDG